MNKSNKMNIKFFFIIVILIIILLMTVTLKFFTKNNDNNGYVEYFKNKINYYRCDEKKLGTITENI